MWNENYQDCLSYIDTYWDTVTHKPTLQTFNRHVFPIPYHYVVPNHRKYNNIFYWDSYFMFRGLMGTKRSRLMKSMVNNFEYLFNKYDIIPNSNHAGFANRSQPPFLSSMILDVYRTPHTHGTFRQALEKIFSKVHSFRQKRWLKNAIEVAKKEYFLVWLDVENAYNHRVEGYGLSRYGDRDIGYANSSEIESGWDFTSRFYNRCNEFLPIDLNVYLYKYERDFALVDDIFGDTKEAGKWRKTAPTRKEEINTYTWNEKEGFYFDYGYNYKKQSEFYSLAGFTPLWARMATYEQAKKMVKKLPLFESDFGLFITAKESLAKPIDLSKIQRRYHPALREILDPKQWDYPLIWTPPEYLTVIGLLQYGFIKEARRIMEKSVKAHARIFRKYNTFLEKINGETGDKSGDYNYPAQEGFGWTNAAFYRYIQILDALEEKTEIYEKDDKDEFPHELAILH